MKLFICHASTDKTFARKLRVELEKYGFRTWFDEKDINVGDSIFEAIHTAIEMCDYVIIVFSKNTMTRPWVKSEIAAFFNKEMSTSSSKILPILIEESKIPSLLKDKKYADFRGSFKSGFIQLLESLNETGKKYKRIPRVKTVKHNEVIDFELHTNKLAHFTKSITYKCLGTYMIEAWEYFTSDGTIKNFTIHKAKAGKTYNESGIKYYQVLFNEKIYKNDEYSFDIKFDLMNSFNKKIEYWSLKGNGPSDSISIKIRFPKNKPPIRWWVEERDRGLIKPLDEKIKTWTTSGRKVLYYSINQPHMDLQYILKWEW